MTTTSKSIDRRTATAAVYECVCFGCQEHFDSYERGDQFCSDECLERWLVAQAPLPQLSVGGD